MVLSLLNFPLQLVRYQVLLLASTLSLSFLPFHFFYSVGDGNFLKTDPDTAIVRVIQLTVAFLFLLLSSTAAIMMASLKESLAGPGYVILNALRVINIIVFLDMIAAHAVMLVKIDLLTSFFFFEAVGHAIAIVVCSECFLFQTLHSVMDMLTEISFPHSIRTSLLPRVLRPSLAIPRRRFWIYHTSVCNADTWNWSIGRPQYKGYKPRRAWAHILENHHISRNPGSSCQRLECCCGKTYFPTL